MMELASPDTKMEKKETYYLIFISEPRKELYKNRSPIRTYLQQLFERFVFNSPDVKCFGSASDKTYDAIRLEQFSLSSASESLQQKIRTINRSCPITSALKIMTTSQVVEERPTYPQKDENLKLRALSCGTCWPFSTPFSFGNWNFLEQADDLGSAACLEDWGWDGITMIVR